MKILLMTAALTMAAAAPSFAQSSVPSQGPNGTAETGPSDRVGNGTAKALDSSISNQTGNSTGLGQPEHRRKVKRTARASSEPVDPVMTPPGTAPKNGTDKPDGTTGAPPYGSTAPNAGVRSSGE